ncbi:Hypothetical protein CM240_2018 [Clostridium bornimense]|uniref:Uncharacterized protein n=1 Tax=Clostridium bornimense TaxID=1216932 RepID=W6RWX4_9CLOT|nr:hypothetical protein [Clostridium bornimense]CDM69176.1 Hypothetical protein CM240_2018 [Clostridium bornimense]
MDDNSLNKYPKIRFNKTNIRDIIIGTLLLVIVILGGIIVYLVNNNNNDEVLQTVSQFSDTLVKANEEITLRTVMIRAIDNFEEKEPSSVLEEEKLEYLNKIKVFNESGNAEDLNMRSKENLIDREFVINKKLYVTSLEDGKIIFTHYEYERPYILKTENNLVNVYKVDGSGQLKLVRNTDIKLQIRESSDLRPIQEGKAQIKEDSDDNIKNYLHLFIS